MPTKGVVRLSDDAELLAFFRAIANHDFPEVTRMVESLGDAIATRALRVGASRQDPTPYFLVEIAHHVYVGDTGLHIAAATYQLNVARLLVAKGAAVRARNRRGAEPLHYATDGNPAGIRWNPEAQRDVIAYLLAHGADPNARDRSGTTPLHRAVRTRCTAAVQALLDGGAHPKMPNGSGSTPLHLAVQNTGRGGSGDEATRAQQRAIIEILLQHGAKPTDADARGKTVEAAATSVWVRELLT